MITVLSLKFKGRSDYMYVHADLALPTLQRREHGYVRSKHVIGTNPSQKLVSTQSRLLMTLIKKHFENMEEKGENAGKQYFLLFP